INIYEFVNIITKKHLGITYSISNKKPLPMKKILIIEDDDLLSENVSLLLNLSGYDVFCANDGKTGVEMALKENPDLILCDIKMPNLDGYGVLHILNNHPKTATVPFIFLTGSNETESLRKGMTLGA